jgi:predicted nucleotidyltransferase
MHIYAFGSVCRGEIDKSSDIDLLAITGRKAEIDPNVFSIYSYQRLEELWKEGNPFAWHLAFESRLIFSNDNSDFIESLGVPNEYTRTERDCLKFYTLFDKAVSALETVNSNYVFEL